MLTFEVEKFAQNAFTLTQRFLSQKAVSVFSSKGLRYTVHDNVAEKGEKKRLEYNWITQAVRTPPVRGSAGFTRVGRISDTLMFAALSVFGTL